MAEFSSSMLGRILCFDWSLWSGKKKWSFWAYNESFIASLFGLGWQDIGLILLSVFFFTTTSSRSYKSARKDLAHITCKSYTNRIREIAHDEYSNECLMHCKNPRHHFGFSETGLNSTVR